MRFQRARRPAASECMWYAAARCTAAVLTGAQWRPDFPAPRQSSSCLIPADLRKMAPDAPVETESRRTDARESRTSQAATTRLPDDRWHCLWTVANYARLDW